MNINNNAPSLFDDGQIGFGVSLASVETKAASASSLVDLMHDGFYIVFLLKNQYVPSNAESFREKILNLLNRFENQARKLQFSNDDIQDAKYAYCALLDETIVTQQDERFFDLQNSWMMCPLQLSLFGSQLAGYRFFEKMDEIRSKGKERLAALEAYHYCMLLGFHGKYRLESIESLNLLVHKQGQLFHNFGIPIRFVFICAIVVCIDQINRVACCLIVNALFKCAVIACCVDNVHLHVAQHGCHVVNRQLAWLK